MLLVLLKATLSRDQEAARANKKAEESKVLGGTVTSFQYKSVGEDVPKAERVRRGGHAKVQGQQERMCLRPRQSVFVP